jgi:hypothetical protein
MFAAVSTLTHKKGEGMSSGFRLPGARRGVACLRCCAFRVAQCLGSAFKTVCSEQTSISRRSVAAAHVNGTTVCSGLIWLILMMTPLGSHGQTPLPQGFAQQNHLPANAGQGQTLLAKAPWGAAAPAKPEQYSAAKVVYDIAVSSPQALETLLDRISGLDAEYSHDPFEAEIVVVLHGPELAFFDTRNFSAYEALVRRAQSLSVGTAIRFRACQRSASNQGIAPENLHGFLALVPMGDAEIVKLQQQGYAYMH